MPQSTDGPITEFVKRNFRHFNAAVVVDAAEAWIRHLDSGGKMFLTLAGAMSTAELGISLAEMIRREKVHAITATGAISPSISPSIFSALSRPSPICSSKSRASRIATPAI